MTIKFLTGVDWNDDFDSFKRITHNFFKTLFTFNIVTSFMCNHLILIRDIMRYGISIYELPGDLQG
jgi:hypothetical protein